MSVQASSWAWQQRSGIDNPNTFLTLLALAEHASPTGKCWPSRGTIAQMVGFANKGSVTRHINALVDQGLVNREPQHQENGRQRRNLYRLAMGDGGSVADQPGGGGPASRGQGVADQPPLEPLVVEPSKEPPPKPPKGDAAFDPAVVKVWDHYCEVFSPERAKLGPSRARGIQRALQEVQSADDLCVAVDGLFAYRKHRPGDTMIETIWKTYRGTGSMSERIEFFISQAPGFRSRNAGLPSGDRAIVAQHKQNVQRGHRSDDPETVETAERSEAWLRERGIETVRRESDGYPIFPGPGVPATEGSE